ncbi:uncharacterized protein F4812DRAFT_462641 [Daldinia caldariorum]|uniref:uncharacterized protein n=1 Tax=Daldinia caldariorum TaxID=326644 RepID=UPI00200818E4|nr:uncharacterized protein F4812DRAFT_462641 [Daldinia caldariorum]KAI1464581.1 hypothetical protein F4812DRAFT_462641 [Daldinia caldariorum]
MSLKFPQPAGPALARLAYQQIYGQNVREDIPGDIVVRDEYLGWISPVSLSEIDYYGVTFDHPVPADDPDPDVLQINIIEIEDDGGDYANANLPFIVDPVAYIGKKILAVPRCCQKRKGTQDRMRMNSSVIEIEQGNMAF